uniref:Vanin-like protein 1 n=1 Tax=Cacopsylla melanoneura TaxID=428564 RepID=A0A8D8TLY8_9HEMI
MVHKKDAREREHVDYYTAAVVEYTSINMIQPEKQWTVPDLMQANAEQFVKIIQNASHYDVDIIVFPECGLSGTPMPKKRAEIKPYLTSIPNPTDHVIPYKEPQNYAKVLTVLSKAAAESNMYVVVNMPERVKCPVGDFSTICNGIDTEYHYNTNVVFDRQGQIIAKYRKYNLFLEFGFDAPPQPELVTFDTDFGVTFGVFICFDILFTQPAVELVRQKNVTDFVFSAAWMSELPLLTAVTVHSSWAFSMDVNLLSSNLNKPAQYGGGSGIYAGRHGVQVAVMPQYTGSQLLISRVPKKNSPRPLRPAESRRHVVPIIPPPIHQQNQLRLLCDSSYSSFHSKPLECIQPNDKNTSTFSYSEPKHGFSCSIEVVWTNKDCNNNMPSYKMFGYAGERTFSGAKTCYIEVCGLSAVTNDAVGCGKIPDLYHSGVTIHSISINVSSSSGLNSIAVPITINSSVVPIHVTDYTFNNDGKSIQNIQMNLVKPSTDLITFAVYRLPQEVS